MIKILKCAYESLGNNKAQRFRRLFLILVLIAVVILYGFHQDAINITLGIKPSGVVK